MATTSKMQWNKLISNKRLGLEQYHDPGSHTRSDFQRDYDRMIFSSPFRRLQNKTQVFPLPGSIFVHNRLTHSLEVSSVGRSMAEEVSLGLQLKSNGCCNRLSDIADIVATACLCHDLGNPPFGHSGEKAISSYFSEGNGKRLKPMLTLEQWHDLIHFEGNANSFRLLTHSFCGRRPGGFAMTYTALSAMVKYPYASIHAGNKGKFGFFDTEKQLFKQVADELGIICLNNEQTQYVRHPLVYIMEAADDICYQIMDIEDAHKLKILGTEEVTTLLRSYFAAEKQPHIEQTLGLVSDPNEKVAYLRSKVIGALVRECAEVFVNNEETILSGELQGSLIDNMQNPDLKQGYANCTDTAYNKIYNAPDVVDIELAGNTIITYLIDRLLDAVLQPDNYASKLLLLKVPQQYNTKAPDLYGKIQSVLDHVSAMTDVYALDLYRKLKGLSLPAV